MTIAEVRDKCKSLLSRDILIVAILVLASSFSFGLGYLAGSEEKGSETSLSTATLSPLGDSSEATGQYVASKSGTKYYLPSCAGASRISEANKVWFASVVAAAAAGYTPAANCKGL